MKSEAIISKVIFGVFTLLMTIVGCLSIRWMTKIETDVAEAAIQLSINDGRIAVNDSRFTEIVRRLDRLELKIDKIKGQ